MAGTVCRLEDVIGSQYICDPNGPRITEETAMELEALAVTSGLEVLFNKSFAMFRPEVKINTLVIIITKHY